MSNWKQDMVDAMEAGKQPTYDQLEAALNGAMNERNSMEKMVCDMAKWLGKMTVAHLHGGDLPSVMNEFIAERVRMQVAQTTH